MLKLLDEERRALLAGDIAWAAKLAGRKAALLDAFDPETTDRAILTQIGTHAIYNHGLLDAARRGIEAARERVAAILHAGPGETYSVLGQKQPLHPSKPSLHKLA